MRKTDVRSIYHIDDYLRRGRPRKIKLQRPDAIQDMNIKEFFEYFIDERPATLYLRGSLHCEQDRSRSLYDFSLLCLQYFPDYSMTDIIKVVFNYYYNKQGVIRKIIAYCPDIRKYNFRSRQYGSRGLQSGIIARLVYLFMKDYSGIHFNTANSELLELRDEFLVSVTNRN